MAFRRDHYHLAIKHYYFSIPVRTQNPQRMDEQLKVSKTSRGRRNLRLEKKDPFTGEDFVEILATITNRIIRVYSSSSKEPLKQANCPERYKDFDSKKAYSELWFAYCPSQGKLTAPARRLSVFPPELHRLRW